MYQAAVLHYSASHLLVILHYIKYAVNHNIKGEI